MPGSVDLVLIARQEAKLRHVAAELSEQFGISAKVIVADLAKLKAWSVENLFSLVPLRPTSFHGPSQTL